MGEEKAARESIICIKDDGIFRIDDHLQDEISISCLCNMCRDNLICVHSNACEYNNCKNSLTIEEALMMKHKGIKGEMSFAS